MCGVVASGPVAPAGAVFATVAHPSLCTTDTAGGTPCGNGDAIRWWKDLVSGTWYEQATSGSRLILRADGATWYAENDGTRLHVFGAAPAAYPLEFAAGYRSTDTDGIVFGVSNGGAQNAVLYKDGANSLAGLVQAGTNRFYASVAATGASDRVAAVSLSGTLASFLGSVFVDGTLLAGPTAGTSASLTDYNWCVTSGKGGISPAAGRFYAGCGFDAVQTAPQRAAYESWLREYMP